MRISDWSSDVCSSDLEARIAVAFAGLSGTAGAGDMRLDGQSLSGEMRGAMDVAGATHILVVEADGGMAIVAADAPGVGIGRAACRERVGPYVWFSVVAGFIKTNKQNQQL